MRCDALRRAASLLRLFAHVLVGNGWGLQCTAALRPTAVLSVDTIRADHTSHSLTGQVGRQLAHAAAHAFVPDVEPRCCKDFRLAHMHRRLGFAGTARHGTASHTALEGLALSLRTLSATTTATALSELSSAPRPITDRSGPGGSRRHTAHSAHSRELTVPPGHSLAAL
jgi:hypothetical protein